MNLILVKLFCFFLLEILNNFDEFGEVYTACNCAQLEEKLFDLEKMTTNLSTLFMNINPTVWVLAPISLMVEAEEHFAAVLAEVGTVVGMLLKVVHDARVQLGALLLLNFSLSFCGQPEEVDSEYIHKADF